jgi:hypothetical protein
MGNETSSALLGEALPADALFAGPPPDVDEALLYTEPETFVYRVGARASAQGHTAASWGLEAPLLTASLAGTAADIALGASATLSASSGGDMRLSAAPSPGGGVGMALSSAGCLLATATGGAHSSYGATSLVAASAGPLLQSSASFLSLFGEKSVVLQSNGYAFIASPDSASLYGSNSLVLASDQLVSISSAVFNLLVVPLASSAMAPSPSSSP